MCSKICSIIYKIFKYFLYYNIVFHIKNLVPNYNSKKPESVTLGFISLVLGELNGEKIGKMLYYYYN